MSVADTIKAKLAARLPTLTEIVQKRRAPFVGIPTWEILERFASLYAAHRDVLPTREGGGGPYTEEMWQRLFRPFDAMRFELEERGHHATVKSIMRSLERCSPRRRSR